MTFRSETLVFGSGDCAREVAAQLVARGIGVVMAAGDPAQAVPSALPADLAQVRLEPARLVGCRGQAGAFQVVFGHDSARVIHQVSGIVVAEEAFSKPNFDDYGLQASQRVFSLSDIEDRLAVHSPGECFAGNAHVVFLNSWQQDSHPVTSARMLRLCLQMQKSGMARTVFMTGNLKVSIDDMEECYQQAKAAGSVFLKFTEHMPRIAELADGRVQLDFRDETTGLDCRLPADYVIVDESIAASPLLGHLADVLRLERDAYGFLQSDNVHRLSNSTNRRGVFVAGGSRALFGGHPQRDDAGRAALKVAEFLSDLDRDPLLRVDPRVEPKVQIDQGRCARCLTCYRLCPYAAVEMAPRMTIVAEACQGCGLCAAGCPNQAIQVDAPHLGAALEQLARPVSSSIAAGDIAPRLAAFCCRRSAVQARELAVSMGHRLPPGLVFVEGLCGGTFSVNHLLSAMEAGMDGVMVLTCHPGNCHSEEGTTHARKRASEAAKALALAGVEPARIQYSTLSANMGSEFVHLTHAFAQRIAALGPGQER